MVGFVDAAIPQRVLDEYAHNQSFQFIIDRPLGAAYVVEVAGSLTANQRTALIQQLKADPRIRYAEEPPRLRVQFTPNELATSDQWYLTEAYGIGAQQAWDITRGVRDVVIALLDTGILPHQDLNAGRILTGYDFISDSAYSNDGNGRDPDPTDPGDAVTAGECGIGEPAMDSSWHGLQVAGVIAATADNGIGVAGVDHAVRILPVRVLGKCGGDFIDVLEAMLWTAGFSVTGVPDNPTPAQVINMSFSGIGECSSPIQDIIDQVVGQGVVVVAAAGNNNADAGQRVPANCASVIAVAATDRGGDRASYSNQGSVIDLAAPGGDGVDAVHTLSNKGASIPGGDAYVGVIGSSFSAAMVSAGATLLLAENAALAPEDTLFYLQSGAQPFPPGSTCSTLNCGAGLLNLHASLDDLITASANAASSSSMSNTATQSSGGGGGCVLRTQPSRTMDVTWLLLLLWFGLVVFRQHTARVWPYVR